MASDTGARGGQASGDREVSFGRGAALLSALIGVTGLLTYAFHSLAAHALGIEDYGAIAALWAAVFLTASVIYRPVEQLLSRTIAEREAQGISPSSALRVAATIQLGLAFLFVIAALLLRDLLEEHLFAHHTTLYWAFVLAVIFYGASYFARGFLAGQRRFGLYGGLVLMESASRVLIVVLVVTGVVTVDDERSLVAIAIAAAPLLSLCVVPWALRGQVRRMRARPAAEPGEAAGAVESNEPQFTMARGLSFAGAVLVIMVSEQMILNSGVLIVQLKTESEDLTALVFAVLMIARAPLQLFQAVSTTLLPHLTRLVVREQKGLDAGDFSRSVRMTVIACLVFGGLTVIGVLAVGPQVMRLLFGDEFIYDRLGLVYVATGMGLYLAATTINQAVLARGRARLAATCWAASATFFVAFLLIGQWNAVREVEVAFVATAVLLSSLLYLVYRSGAQGTDEVRPGSTEELELRLAAADEGS